MTCLQPDFCNRVGHNDLGISHAETSRSRDRYLPLKAYIPPNLKDTVACYTVHHPKQVFLQPENIGTKKIKNCFDNTVELRVRAKKLDEKITSLWLRSHKDVE